MKKGPQFIVFVGDDSRSKIGLDCWRCCTQQYSEALIFTISNSLSLQFGPKGHSSLHSALFPPSFKKTIDKASAEIQLKNLFYFILTLQISPFLQYLGYKKDILYWCSYPVKKGIFNPVEGKKMWQAYHFIFPPPVNIFRREVGGGIALFTYWRKKHRIMAVSFIHMVGEKSNSTIKKNVGV